MEEFTATLCRRVGARYFPTPGNELVRKLDTVCSSKKANELHFSHITAGLVYYTIVRSLWSQAGLISIKLRRFLAHNSAINA